MKEFHILCFNPCIGSARIQLFKVSKEDTLQFLSFKEQCKNCNLAPILQSPRGTVKDPPKKLCLKRIFGHSLMLGAPSFCAHN
jgi:hypothetical protein